MSPLRKDGRAILASGPLLSLNDSMVNDRHFIVTVSVIEKET